MSEKQEDREDKEVYNFTQALHQPIWVQKITETVSLPFAVKLTSIVWFILFVSIAIWLSLQLARLTPLPFPFWIVFGGFAAFYSSIVVADLKIDQKNFVKFFMDYVIFYWKYGRKAKKYYLNDGFIYRNQKQILEKEVTYVFKK